MQLGKDFLQIVRAANWRSVRYLRFIFFSLEFGVIISSLFFESVCISLFAELPFYIQHFAFFSSLFLGYKQNKIMFLTRENKSRTKKKNCFMRSQCLCIGIFVSCYFSRRGSGRFYDNPFDDGIADTMSRAAERNRERGSACPWNPHLV